MALYYYLPVFKDVYKLILKIFEYTQGFPIEYKYTLCQDMKLEDVEECGIRAAVFVVTEPSPSR